MPSLMRHTKLESSRLLHGQSGITGAFFLTTDAGTTATNLNGAFWDGAAGGGAHTFHVWDVHGCPHDMIAVIGVQLFVLSVGAGDTVVVNHVDTDQVTAVAMTDTANLALFAINNVIDFADLNVSTDEEIILKGENISVVTASDALSIVVMHYVVGSW